MKQKVRTKHCLFTIALLAATSVLPVASASQRGPAEVQSLPQPGFDVVSIRLMKEDSQSPQHITNSLRSGSIRANNVNLKALLEVAYDLPDTRMFGGPAWLNTSKFFLEAKTSSEFDRKIASLPPDEAKQIKRKMVAALLGDRFHLVVHTEKRDMPVYALIVAKGGPKLSGGSPGADTSPLAGDRIDIKGGKQTLEILTYELSWRLGRPVLDQTGLEDQQPLTLHWQDADETAPDSNGPSMFTALQEQLGLKLESKRAMVPVLVIDHVERPSDN